MVYESSYESGRKPFSPDLERGRWASGSDFIFACMGLAFKMDMFSISWWFFYDMGIAAIVPNFICMGLFMVPLMVIQSFMGQFSSSGYISAFRLSPVFKGMGYVSLALNITMLMYYSIFAVVPLLFLINSFRPTLPWSCEAFQEWGKYLNESERLTICNITERVTPEPEPEQSESELDFTNKSNDYPLYDYRQYHVPSVLYFREHFENINFTSYDVDDYEISWVMLSVTFLVWALIALIFYFCSDTAKFGKMLRYGIWLTLALLAVCFARFLFLPGALLGFSQYMRFRIRDFEQGIAAMPIYVLQAFGGGWGSIIALSSFNKFKTNIMEYSWVICLGQTAIFLFFGLLSYMLQFHFRELTEPDYYAYVEEHWTFFLSTASAISNLQWANLWSILFYTMLLLAALVVMTTQFFGIVKSLFDEFELLRSHKQAVTFGLIGFLALTSVYFSSNHGILYFTGIQVDSVVTQTILHLLLLLAVLWIYGRVRFQRDFEFMLNKPFQTWKVNVLRFVSPICLALTLLAALFVAYHEHIISAPVMVGIGVILIVLPLVVIPAYAVFIMIDTAGTTCMRFRRAARPTDWYPLDPEYRQQYEEAMGNMDITHQLREVEEDFN